MKNIKKTIILILALCSFMGAYSQTKTTIRGKVIDQKDKSAVIGATVIESDKENRVVNGTITDIDGNFVYQMKNPENTMKVSVIGYQNKAFTPNPTKAVVIELISSDIELDQVTITAKAKSDNSLTNIDERDNASSRVKVDLMEMKDAGMTSAADALQGKVAGLDIISASGDPGSGSQIVIRGLSSMGNSKPLIVIDGIPQDKVNSNFDVSTANQEDISNLINIALQDIKSIEVLKDAASTAVYGSKGADGVLLIETYRGRMGKVQFDYQYKNSMNFQPAAIPMLNGNEYITLQLEQLHNQKGVFDIPNEIAYNRDFSDFYNYSANTDWLGAITKNSTTHDNYFKISGGGEKTRYFTSFSYVDEGGTTIGTSSKRFSTRVNLDYFLSRKLTFTVSFNYTKNRTDKNVSWKVDGWDRNVRAMAYIKAPNMSIMEHDAKGNLTGEYFTRNIGKLDNYQGNGTDFYNPVAVARLGTDNTGENSLENSFRLKYNVNEWLIFRETVSFQYYGKKWNEYLPYNAIGADWLAWNVNKGSEENMQSSSIKTESQLAFDVPFADKKVHSISGAATFISNQGTAEAMQVQSNHTPSTDIQDPAIGGEINWMGSWRSENRDLGALLNLNYKLLDRYMVQGTVRADGNSGFGISRRWGLFEGVSLGWRVSDEPLLSGWKSWMGDCMFRATWGVSGRPPSDNYARFATFDTKAPGSYVTNPAIVPTKIQLNNLQWENMTSSDLGLELNLFKDRWYLEGDIYIKRTTNMLFKDYKIPTSSGYDKLGFFNGGELENQGWEFMTNYKVIRTKDWLLTVDFNISQNINTFTVLPDNFNREKDVTITNGQYPKRVEAGQPIGSFFGFRYLGVWSSDADVVATDAAGNKLYDSENRPIPVTYKGEYAFKGGDAKYEDINHDGKIDLNDVVFIGDSNPEFTGGFGTSLRYKHFDFSFQFYYRLGFDIINMNALNTEGMNGKNNQSKAVLYRWRVPGQNEENSPGLLPRAYMDNPANNLGSDRYVEKGDFLRLNNVKLGYQFSQALCQKLNLQSANLSVSARKLMTFTNYSGQDPEVGQNATDAFWVGADNSNTPPPKVVTLSLSVGF